MSYENRVVNVQNTALWPWSWAVLDESCSEIICIFSREELTDTTHMPEYANN